MIAPRPSEASTAPERPLTSDRDVKCERCPTVGRRQHMRPCPPGWLYLETQTQDDVVITWACSRECANAMWCAGPGPIMTDVTDPLPEPRPNEARPAGWTSEEAVGGLRALRLARDRVTDPVAVRAIEIEMRALASEPMNAPRPQEARCEKCHDKIVPSHTLCFQCAAPRPDKAQASAFCSDGTDADEPSDRGFVCCHEAERDRARNEVARLVNHIEQRNTTDACEGTWETCWCSTCKARRDHAAEFGEDDDTFEVVSFVKWPAPCVDYPRAAESFDEDESILLAAASAAADAARQLAIEACAKACEAVPLDPLHHPNDMRSLNAPRQWAPVFAKACRDVAAPRSDSAKAGGDT